MIRVLTDSIANSLEIIAFDPDPIAQRAHEENKEQLHSFKRELALRDELERGHTTTV